MAEVDRWRFRGSERYLPQDHAAMTTELKRRLAAKFRSAHAVLFEVPVIGPDWNTDRETWRRIDAVAVGVTDRSNYLIHGFEIKTTRSDLMIELSAEQSKSLPGRRVCDCWWLVLPTLDLFICEEPPDGWGVLVPCERGLWTVLRPQRTAPIRDHRFTAKLVQAALRSIPGQEWMAGERKPAA